MGDVTLSAALAGDVAVGVKSLVGSVGGASVDVVPSAIAGVASPADCVGVASSTDSVGFVDLPETLAFNCESDCLADGRVEDCDTIREFAQSSGELGLPAHHPRFLQWVGAPESACLLDGSRGAWIRSLSREQSIDAARQLHRDVCLMTSNLNILDQYVLCLQGTATKLLELTLGKQDFPSAAVASAASLPRMLWFIWKPWASGTLPWARLIVLKPYILPGVLQLGGI